MPKPTVILPSFNWVAEANDKIVEYIEHDHIACMCRLILLCTHCNRVSDPRNLHELHRFKKNHIQIYVSISERKKKNLLNLLKSSIPDISTRLLTIFNIKTLEKLCQFM